MKKVLIIFILPNLTVMLICAVMLYSSLYEVHKMSFAESVLTEVIKTHADKEEISDWIELAIEPSFFDDANLDDHSSKDIPHLKVFKKYEPSTKTSIFWVYYDLNKNGSMDESDIFLNNYYDGNYSDLVEIQETILKSL